MGLDELDVPEELDNCVDGKGEPDKYRVDLDGIAGKNRSNISLSSH